MWKKRCLQVDAIPVLTTFDVVQKVIQHSFRSLDSNLTFICTANSKTPTGSSQFHFRSLLLTEINMGESVSSFPHISQGLVKSEGKVDGIILGF
jgi:hypothetical protein